MFDVVLQFVCCSISTSSTHVAADGRGRELAVDTRDLEVVLAEDNVAEGLGAQEHVHGAGVGVLKDNGSIK